jgi:hypothetical protein
MIRLCLTCGMSEASHQRDDHGACGTFAFPTRAELAERLTAMACEALSTQGRARRSRLDAQVLIAAAHVLEER